jgi:hypothetical protein
MCVALWCCVVLTFVWCRRARVQPHRRRSGVGEAARVRRESGDSVQCRRLTECDGQLHVGPVRLERQRTSQSTNGCTLCPLSLSVFSHSRYTYVCVRVCVWCFVPVLCAQVRDVWARTDLGVFSGGFGAVVKPHDVLFFTATLQGEGKAEAEDYSDEYSGVEDESDGGDY